MGICIALKCFLGFQSFFHSGCLLEVDIGEAGEVINKDCSIFVPLCGELPCHLCNDPWSWGHHLIQ